MAALRLTILRRHGEGVRLLLLASLVVACLAAVVLTEELWPISVFVIPLLLASLFLGPRHLPWFVVGTLSSILVVVPQLGEIGLRIVVNVAVVFAVGLLVLLTSFRRSRLGVAGAQGESMLVDLRDRIQSQGMLPALPAAWYAETALRSAGGTPFAGDFVVATRPGSGRTLELAVVDVSGKGEDAGTRSLLLSGAFSGLLGAMPPERFLSAANDYLLRQNWEEGFATAIHLSLDLETGEFDIRTAGHPPAVQMHAGSGRWQVLDCIEGGPILGLMDEVDFPALHGTLRAGDAVLLYTDGLVETRNRDISLGIDKLQGWGERLLRHGIDDGARRLIEKLGAQDDDRALVLVHRR